MENWNTPFATHQPVVCPLCRDPARGVPLPPAPPVAAPMPMPQIIIHDTVDQDMSDSEDLDAEAELLNSEQEDSTWITVRSLRQQLLDEEARLRDIVQELQLPDGALAQRSGQYLVRENVGFIKTERTMMKLITELRIERLRADLAIVEAHNDEITHAVTDALTLQAYERSRLLTLQEHQKEHEYIAWQLTSPELRPDYRAKLETLLQMSEALLQQIRDAQHEAGSLPPDSLTSVPNWQDGSRAPLPRSILNRPVHGN